MDMEGVPTIARITASTTGQDIFGVVVGFLPNPTSLQNKHRAASTNAVALVVTDPTVIYESGRWGYYSNCRCEYWS